MFRSPRSGKISITRVLGTLCIVSANFIGVYGVFSGVEHSGTVATLGGVAGIALLVRDRVKPEPEEGGYGE